jgi:hypothetical protein
MARGRLASFLVMAAVGSASGRSFWVSIRWSDTAAIEDDGGSIRYGKESPENISFGGPKERSGEIKNLEVLLGQGKNYFH